MATRPIPPAERPAARQLLWTSLLVMAASLPLLRFLDWRVSAFLLFVFAVRLAGLRWPSALPGTWMRALLMLAGSANCLYANQTLVGQDGGTALLVTMLGLKLLELNSRRDLRLSIILIGFLIVAEFLFDQSFPLALYLGAIVVAALVLLADLGGGLGGTDPRRALRIALLLSAQSIPLALVLFLLFPRLTAPLWDLGLDDRRGTMGMSDTMEPGNISELVVNGDLAFRARFASPPPNPDQLYWRGPVLWEMDGRRWSPGNHPAAWDAPTRLVAATQRLDYEVVLEPSRQTWVFALDMPLAAPPDTAMGADFQLRANQPISAPKRYRLSSALAYRTAEPGEQLRRYALGLPANITPRMRELVAGWQSETSDQWQLVQRALGFFNRERFSYTLLPPPLGTNPADAFLFETRAGFCEHYASAFALLMRIGGVPSRVVLGYLGGEPNGLVGHYAIWQSDAHAWVEVLIAGRGWVRVDPTAAIDPSRIDHRSATRLLGAGSSVRFDLHQASQLAHLLREFRRLGDTLDAVWQNWVLDFSAEDQLDLMDRLGLGALREYGLVALMVAAVALTLGLTLLAMLRDEGRRDPLDRLYAVFCRRLARGGLPRRPSEGPRDYGRRVAALRPDLAPAVAGFLALYLPARFGPHPDPGAIDRLRRLLRAFRPRRLAGR